MRADAMMARARNVDARRQVVRERMSSRSQALDVSVQYATSRSGIPHAASMAEWANAAFAASGARRVRDLPMTIRIVGAAESRRLNRTWRGKDKPTNVLSFPSAASGLRATDAASLALPLGDLAICAPVVAREAREQGKETRAHWAHMVVHGVLHLLGYDHENDRDADVMEAREVKILSQFGYSNPYA
jgi:probable rRNA maturation factor